MLERWPVTKSTRYCFLSFLLILPLLCLPRTAVAVDEGKICIGPNLTIVSPNEWKDDLISIGIDDLPPHSFAFHQQPTIVRRDLDTDKTYVVRVYARREVVASWRLNFSKLRTTTVQIWRSKGYWHMDPIDESKCK